MVVRLTHFELQQAAIAGAMRQLEAIRLGRADNHGASGAGWNLHIEGAIAELAVAKAINRFWNAVVDDPHSLEGDVGSWQVRSTHRDRGCLLLHPEDPEAPYFLVVRKAPAVLDVKGWIMASDGKRQEWWREDTGRPAYFVPQSALREFGAART